MLNVVLICVVFTIGFGWGAAAMVIPMRTEIKKNTEQQIEVLKALTQIADTQKTELKALSRLSDYCGSVLVGTKGIIGSVDKLIEEIGNEV